MFRSKTKKSNTQNKITFMCMGVHAAMKLRNLGLLGWL